MATIYIASDDVFTKRQMYGMGCWHALVMFALSLLVGGLIYLVNLSSVRFAPGLLALLAWLVIAIVGLPMWIAARHRIKIATFARFQQFGVTYALILYVLTFVPFSIYVYLEARSGLDVIAILMVGFLLPLAFIIGLVVAWLFVWLLTPTVRVYHRGFCRACNYNITGLSSDTCPECGEVNPCEALCMQCGYNLTGLQSDRCPECGLKIIARGKSDAGGELTRL